MIRRPTEYLPFPTVIDERARKTPQKVFAAIPNSTRLEDGYRDVTYLDVSRAINRLSWWLDANMGVSEDCDTVAYLGPADLRYSMIVVAAMKTNRKTLLPLPSNSLNAHVHLLRQSNCNTLLTSSQTPLVWRDISRQQRGTRVLIIPGLESLLDDVGEAESYPYNKSYDEAKTDIVHIGHTSGTTGHPKLVAFTVEMCTLFDRHREMSDQSLPGERVYTDLLVHKRILSPMPGSWVLGLAMILHKVISLDMIPVLLPSNVTLPITADYIDRVHQTIPIDGGLYVPDTLVQISKVPEYVNRMKSVKLILYGGAPLSQPVGNLFSKVCRIQPLAGATETGPFPLLVADQSDWGYYRFPANSEFVFQEFQDDLYELVIKRGDDTSQITNVFRVFPDLWEYHTRDLCRQHLQKKGSWLFGGRVDDFVKLRTLTKFNATAIENSILSHPHVRACVVGGEGRENPFAIIELMPGIPLMNADTASKIEYIWPVIESTNRKLSQEICLSRSRLLITSPERPIRTLTKGVVDRRQVLQAYSNDINKLYENV